MAVAYPNGAVVEVQAQQAGAEGVVFRDPVLDLLADDLLRLRARLAVVVGVQAVDLRQVVRLFLVGAGENGGEVEEEYGNGERGGETHVNAEEDESLVNKGLGCCWCVYTYN